MKQYGLIGHPLSHSFSSKYFNQKFKNENILECSYNLFDIDNISLLPELLQRNPNLCGLNVTIPFKESILNFLTDIDEEAKLIGAVNTIKISDNIIGYNTDSFGFKKSLKPFLNVNHERALIFGTGGAAKTVKHILNELNIGYLLVSRNPSNEFEIAYDDINDYVIKHHQLIINASPIGMFPNIADCPTFDYSYLSSKHLLYDLVYNPTETEFLRKGKEQNCLIINGMQMLKLQAEKSWEIWNT